MTYITSVYSYVSMVSINIHFQRKPKKCQSNLRLTSMCAPVNEDSLYLSEILPLSIVKTYLQTGKTSKSVHKKWPPLLK